ncbi:MAG: divergent polysaccharide deacetylase family protein [Alphaproteobacteria bacterium]
MLINKKKIFSFLIAFVFLIIICGCGYLIALQKNQPKYNSEIERVLFETKNKPPKFLLHISDTKNKDKKLENKDTAEESISNNKFEPLKNIPSFSKLSIINNKKRLNVIKKQETKKAWLTYSKDFVLPQNFYKVAIVINSVGLSQRTFDSLLETIPENISYSFSPYTPNIEQNVEKAREHGHETYLDLLLSPEDIFHSDNGPLSLKITSSIDDNIKTIEKSINKNIAIGGLITSKGMADITAAPRLASVLNFIKDQGLLFIDLSNGPGFDKVKKTSLPRNKADIIIDKDTSLDEIKIDLKKAEYIAQKKGYVLIVTEPKPIAIVELIKWINTFSQPAKTKEELITLPKRPYVLAPLSSVVIE